MASAAVRERLSQDIGRWLTDGLIDDRLHAQLRERYSADQAGLAQLVRMLGIAGGTLVLFGILGFVAAAAGSLVFSAVLLEAVGAGLLFVGLRMARDPLGRYGFSSKAVLTVGVSAVCSGLGLVMTVLQVAKGPFWLGLICVPLVIGIAYATRTAMLLLIGLLGLFHWVGSFSRMAGRSSYELDIEDPRWMAAAALAAIAVGIWHELRLQRQTGRFYLTWEACGLVYLNLSLLLLTIFPEHFLHAARDGLALTWIAVFAAAGFVQLFAGARLHNGLFTGFGVTALVLNFYTRFYEHFWSALSKGSFFLVAGLVLLAAGAGFELVKRPAAAETTA